MPATSRPRKRTPAIPAVRLPEVLDVHMTAQFLTVSADTVYDLFHRGDLPGRKVGRKWLTTKTAVLRWLEESTKRSTEAIPYPLPVGSGLLQDLGFLSFTLPQVAILMPTKKPRGAELTLEQQLANQALHQRRLRIEHVNSSVKRCRIVKDRIRLWKEGVRDLVMELCCALHDFRVRLTPWQPMI